MKIQEISFQNHKVFNDLQLFLDQSISLIIGENGTGKSMILEEIIEYLYSFTTNNNSRYIKINNNFTQEVDNNFRVIYYYAGNNNRAKGFFEDFEEKYIKGLTNNELKPKQFFLHKDVYFEFILIALAVIQQKNLNQGIEIYNLQYFEGVQELSPITKFFVENEFGTEGLHCIDSISIYIDVPSRKKIYKSKEGPRGILKNVLETLNFPTDNSYIKSLTIQNLLGLYEKNICREGSFEIFEILDALYCNNIISEEGISVSLRYKGKTINSKDLSEGERQKYGLLMLIEYMSRQGDAIHLYDEPDTFLHPSRQLSFLDDIKKQFPTHEGSQAIITTHSPLLVGSMEDIDIIGLGKDGVLCSTNNEKNGGKQIDVYGNRAEFIYKEVFGLEDTRAIGFEAKIEKIFQLIHKENKSQQDNEEIESIKKIIKENLSDDIDDRYIVFLSKEELSIIFRNHFINNHEEDQ